MLKYDRDHIHNKILSYLIHHWSVKKRVPNTENCHSLCILLRIQLTSNDIFIMLYVKRKVNYVHHLCHTCICVFLTCLCGRGFGF